MSDDASGWNVTDGAPARLAPTAGVLSGGGSSAVCGRVYLRPTPQIVPAALVSLLDPVRDATGQLTDWRLNPARLVRAQPASVAASHEQYARWRSGYVTERCLGDLATLRAFVQWASGRVNVDALRALISPSVVLDPATASRVAGQAEAAAAACRTCGEEGLAIADPSRPGLVRGFVTSDQPLVVLAASNAQLAATSEGLILTQATLGPSFPVAVVSASEQSWTLRLSGWSIEADGVVARTADGTVPLGDTVAGKLLAHTAPGVQTVRTYTVPLTSIFAELLTELPYLARLAARTAAPLVVEH